MLASRDKKVQPLFPTQRLKGIYFWWGESTKRYECRSAQGYVKGDGRRCGLIDPLDFAPALTSHNRFI